MDRKKNPIGNKPFGFLKFTFHLLLFQLCFLCLDNRTLIDLSMVFLIINFTDFLSLACQNYLFIPIAFLVHHFL